MSGGPPCHEVVFELCSTRAAAPDRRDGDGTKAALLAIAGVHEAHVDHHGTWAMVAFDPTVTTVPAITACLSVHGLTACRTQSLGDAPD